MLIEPGSFPLRVEVTTFAHEVGREPRQLAQHIAHAARSRSDAQLVALTLDDKIEVPVAEGQFVRNADGLGVAVFEQSGFGHGLARSRRVDVGI